MSNSVLKAAWVKQSLLGTTSLQPPTPQTLNRAHHSVLIEPQAAPSAGSTDCFFLLLYTETSLKNTKTLSPKPQTPANRNRKRAPQERPWSTMERRRRFKDSTKTKAWWGSGFRVGPACAVCFRGFRTLPYSALA